MTNSLIDSVANTTSHRDRDDLDHSIAQLLLQFLDAESVTIYHLMDDVGNKRVARRIAINRNQSVLGPEPLDKLSTLRVPSDVPAWNECVQRRTVVQYQQPSGLICGVFPVESEHEVIGMLAIEAAQELQERDINLVTGIVRILKNHLALLDYGERDTLTGLLNRKTFEASFGKLRQRLSGAALSHSEPSWLGLVDIDKFKSINDSHGHLFGDEVLLLVGQLMKQSFRGADQLFRFGGEEFVIVLDHASTAGAEIAFERLRAAIEAHPFPQVGRVTISLGYTQIDPQDGPSSCVDRADAALYYAKHHGRNNVRNHETLIASGELTAKSQGADAELF